MKIHLSLKLYLTIFFVSTWITCSSQGSTDSLSLKFEAATSDSSKLKIFGDLFLHHLVRDLSKAKELLFVIDSLCTEIRSEECEANKNMFHGYYHRINSTYDSSIVFFEQGFDLYKNMKNDSKMGVCAFNLGVVNSYMGNYEKAVEKYYLAKTYYEKSENNNGVINVYNSLGIIYKNLNEFDKAITSYSNAGELAEKENNIPMQAMINNNIANLFYQQEMDPDSTIIYANIALNLEQELERNTGIASAYNLLSGAYLDKNLHDKAREYAELAVNYSRKSGSKRFIAIHEMGLADILKKGSNKQLSEQYYLNSIAIADSINLRDLQVHGYKNYAELLSEQGKFKEAYTARLQYEKYKDSLSINESKTKIAELETKYETAIKDKILEEQKQDLNQKTYQRNLLFGGLGLSVLLGGSFIWGLFSRSKRDKKIALQEQDLNQQKIQTLEQEKKLLSMSSILEGQENERIRIAKDLHDGLGGLLTTVKAHFGKIQSEIEKVENLDIYNTANLMIDKAHDEVRRISHNLMPADLRAGGLSIAVRQLVHELRTIHETKTDFELVGFNDDRFNEKIELSVYRIMQELINNITKYANAQSVFIQLSKFEKEIQIVVEDDGQGFDYESALRASGLGLKSIASRVEQMKGSMDVVTSPGNGTSVTVNIPF
ncbi:tetratricopeptide repeat-containing sensor histidine kinase [Portibacter lacus]|uniref:Oxygen sensor histidine kinase NreB n=1 Tax=Portibacter lacus TaxID=1099794 RepID=A0AA37WFM3_9BACT|nr:sensor histidine kinase [Portibacter lacus]GLR18807.1 hypothetical protein GCM10007940_34230 [Portibacter lacus]